MRGFAALAAHDHLRTQAAAFPAARLVVQLSVDRGQRDRGQLAVHFGPHRLVADVALQPHRPK